MLLIMNDGQLQTVERVRGFLEIKGLADVKIIRLASVFEIARRIVNEVLKDHEEKQNRQNG